MSSQQNGKGSSPTHVVKKRRWGLKLLLAVIVVFIVFLLVSPYLVSRQSGWVMGKVSHFAQQQIKVQDLSLTWLGPIRIEGLQVWDKQDRPIVQAASVVWSKGLLGAMTAPLAFGEVNIDKPAVVVYAAQEPQGKKESQAIEKPKGPQKEAKGLPEPKGKLTIQAGKLTVIREDGKKLEVDRIDSQVHLNTLNDIQATWDVIMQTGGRVSGQGQVRELVQGGVLSPASAKGTVKTSSLEPVVLGPLLEFVSADVQAGGNATLALEAEFSGATVNAEWTSEVTGLHLNQAGQAAVKPIDVTLTGQVRADDKQTAGHAALSSQAGQVQSEFTYKTEKDAAVIDFSQLAGAIMGTGTFRLPDIHVKMNGAIDVPQLSAAVPSLLNLQEDVRISHGKFLIENVVFEGGREPLLTGRMRLTDLKGSKGGQPIALVPVVLTVDAKLQEKTGLLINQADLQSDFAQVKIGGSMQALDGQFSMNLDLLQKQLKDFVAMGATQLAGQVQGNLKLARGDAEQVRVNLECLGQGLRYQSEKGQVYSDRMTLTYDGTVDYKENVITHVAAQVAKINFDDQIVAQSSGACDLQKGTVLGSVKLDKVDLGYVTRQSLLSGGQDKGRYGGVITGAMDVERGDKDSPLVSRGAIQAVNLSADRKPLADAPIDAQWSLEMHEQTITVKQLDLKSEPLQAAMQGTIVNYRTTCDLDLKGRYQGDWDKLTKMVHLLSPDSVEVFSMRGVSSSEFTLKGPARLVGATPEFRELSGGTDVTWSEGQLYGLSLGQAALKPMLQGGQVTLGTSAIPVGGGYVRLADMRIDLRGDGPRLIMPGKVSLLDNVMVDKKLSTLFLSRLNPIFTQMAGVQGKVSMALTDIDVPLGEQIKKTGRGSGRLDLSQMQVEPSGLLADLIQLSGKGGKNHSMTIPGVDFVIRDGRIHYENFQVIIDESYQVNFYGSAGFDDTLNLMVSLPVSTNLLQRLKIEQLLGANAEKFSSLRVEVPLVGTRLQPMLNFGGVKTDSLVRELTQSVIQEQAGNLLESIMGGRKKEAQPAQPKKIQPNPDAQPQGQTLPQAEPEAATEPNSNSDAKSPESPK